MSYWVLAPLGVAAPLLAGLVWWLLRKWHDRIESEAYDRGYAKGKSMGCEIGLAQGRIDGQAQERARQAEAEEAKRRSPWARDIPESRVFEVASVPYETVTLRAELHLDDHELQDETKAELLQRLRGELVKEVWQYVDIDRYDEPCWIGSTFRATLRVLQRRG